MIEIPHLEELEISNDEWLDICQLARERDIENPLLLDLQRKGASLGRWDVVYSLSLLAGLETSVLIDSEDNVSLDWGDPGRVILKAPHGFMAPFKLWVHTHPGFMAYWSSTDTNSLALGCSIIEKALVLGSPGIKQAQNSTFGRLSDMDERIEDDGPLSQWSNEEVLGWQEWYKQLNQQKTMERAV
ncbi:MAG: hypothetical protein HN794_02760 [Euryarchaeota archaeon]|jgi:hypothetical protein|nr:hypothetical protein [Euryarchaeota archaeon]MBT7459945.1 hypothetical protein [Euryarchaeota archaeon]